MAYFGTNLFIAVTGIVALMLLGGMLPLWLPGVRRRLPLVLAAAAGIMLATAIIHLIPEAHERLGVHAGFGILAGFVFLYLFERFFTVHICEAIGCEVHTVGLSALFGLSLHTFANGVALGAGIVEGVGGMVFLALAAHKLPEAFSLTAILLHERYRRLTILSMNALFIAMIPLGALMVRYLVVIEGGAVSAWALAFSAGTFLHIAASDLLPEVHKENTQRVPIALAFLLGIVVVCGASFFE